MARPHVWCGDIKSAGQGRGGLVAETPPRAWQQSQRHKCTPRLETLRQLCDRHREIRCGAHGHRGQPGRLLAQQRHNCPITACKGGSRGASGGSQDFRPSKTKRALPGTRQHGHGP